MDNKTPLYNSRIIKTYLEYIDKYHPDIDGDALLEYAGITKHEIRDPAHFLTQYQINRFHEILSQKTDDLHISREVGRYVVSAEAFGTLRTHLLGLLSPMTTYEIVSKIVNKLSRHVTITTTRVGSNKIKVQAIPKYGIIEQPFQCENRLGSLESLAKLHTGHYAGIVHTRCVHKGDDLCEYIVSLKQSRTMLYKRLRNYISIVSLIILLPLWFILPVASWGIFTASAIAIIAMLHASCGYAERKELIKTIEAQSSSAQEFIELTDRLYIHAQLIQEIGQISSTTLDVQTLCEEVTGILVKHLQLDHAAVLLADDSQDNLVYFTGHSHTEHRPFDTMTFNIKGIHSDHPIVQTFISQKPQFTEQASAAHKTHASNSLQSTELMDTSSCICIPIVYEGASLGVLYIENTPATNPSTLSDQNLLVGIASQLAIGIVNAHSFRKLQESEQRYRTIFESTSNPTIIMEEDTTISLANEQFEKLSGYSLHEIENRISWTEFIMEEDLEMMKEQHRMRRIDPETAKRNYEFRFKDRYGTIKNIYLTVDMLPNTTRSVASLLDITEMRQTVEALRKSEERYRLLAENVHDVIWVMDMDFHYTYISPSIENLRGFSVEEAMSQTLEEIYTPDSYQSVCEIISEEMAQLRTKGLHQQISRTFETKQRCKDGSIIWVEVTASILYDDHGRAIGILGITRDISDRKNAELERKNLEAQLQQAQKMEAIGTLAGGIAHDFNNLLMGIQGNASLMLADIDSSHSHYERLKNIEQYVRGGADLTRQLLGFARGGKYVVRPWNINEIIQKSSEMFGRTRKEITIHRKYQENVWAVEIDRGQIEQVLLNLYLNAWQAMDPAGEIYLETQNILLHSDFVRPHNLKAGRYVKISVTDTGIGMDENTLKRVFEPFFTTKEKSRGTGMGLASAYGIILNHEGIINATSAKGEGTTFTIYLPASDKEVVEKKETDRKPVEGTETILLIDDEDMILDIGKQILEHLGYMVMVAKGGKQAVELYQEDPESIDMVILDMIMPDLGGSETYDAIKEINQQVKVLLSSGYSLESKAKEILDKGCNGFIQKPFNIKDLSHKIREVLEKS